MSQIEENAHKEDSEARSLRSIAISLKRIADAMTYVPIVAGTTDMTEEDWQKLAELISTAVEFQPAGRPLKAILVSSYKNLDKEIQSKDPNLYENFIINNIKEYPRYEKEIKFSRT